MIIMCDIDGVLNNLIEKTLELYNSRSDRNIQISDITTYNFFDESDGDDNIVPELSELETLNLSQGSSISIKNIGKKGD